MECANRLKPVVDITHENVFRWALVGEQPVDVEPMRVTLKLGAQAVCSRPRVYLQQKSKRLADYVTRLEAAGMVYRNNQAVYGSVAMTIPKGANSSRLMSDSRAINANIEQAAMSMPNLEILTGLFAGAHAFCTGDILQDVWQMSLSSEVGPLFTMMTSVG